MLLLSKVRDFNIGSGSGADWERISSILSLSLAYTDHMGGDLGVDLGVDLGADWEWILRSCDVSKPIRGSE